MPTRSSFGGNAVTSGLTVLGLPIHMKKERRREKCTHQIVADEPLSVPWIPPPGTDTG